MRSVVAYSLRVRFPRGTAVTVLGAAAFVLLAACTGSVSHPTRVGDESQSSHVTPSAPVVVAASASSSDPADSADSAGADGSTSASSSGSGGAVRTAEPSRPVPSTSKEMSAGIEAAVRAYYAAVNMAFDSGDVSAIEAVTTPACPCRGPIAQIQSLKQNGQHWVGGDLAITSIRVHDLVGNGGSAEVWDVSPPAVLVDEKGRPMATATDPPKGHANMFVIYSHGRWLIANNVLLN
jgi:hypothetical protein